MNRLGEKEYLVKWTNQKKPTWQNEINCVGAPEAVEDYFKALEGKISHKARNDLYEISILNIKTGFLRYYGSTCK